MGFADVGGIALRKRCSNKLWRRRQASDEGCDMRGGECLSKISMRGLKLMMARRGSIDRGRRRRPKRMF